MKNTTKTSSSSPGSSWPAARDGRGRRRGRARGRAASPLTGGTRVSVRIKESRSGDEHGRDDQGDHEELDGDGRRVVDVVVLEREIVGELVGRVVAARHRHARLGDELRLDE